MMNNKRWLAMIALALVCVMIGTGIGMTRPVAQAETVIITSPFTEAVTKVRDSVVGVSNYQMVRVNNGNSNSYYGINPFDFFGFGNFGFGSGYGNGYGYGNGNGGYDGGASEEVEYATGSGVVIADGFVLTNYHVVEDASALKITIAADNEKDAKTLDAELVAYDKNLDVAVMKVEGLNLPAVELGDSDTLQVGDWAICIGNPLSTKFAGTVTAGIVSGLDRSVSESTTTDKYGRKETVTNKMIQVDAAINNGNSGGGMFNTQGQLMGIPTLKYSGSSSTTASIEGIGMCIPINSAKPIIDMALSGNGNAQGTQNDAANNALFGKPRMGVTVAALDSSAVAVRKGVIPMGIFVKEVEEKGPAAKAGIEVGDIIVDIDDNVITNVSQMQEIIGGHKEGDVLKVKVYRVPGLADMNLNDEIPDGEYVDLELTLAIVDDVAQ